MIAGYLMIIYLIPGPARRAGIKKRSTYCIHSYTFHACRRGPKGGPKMMEIMEKHCVFSVKGTDVGVHFGKTSTR